MSSHPTADELFAVVVDGDPGRFAAHLAECGDCREARARLGAGAALLDAARADDDAIDTIDWGRIDGAIEAAAERAAADIRGGRLRAPRPWAGVVAGGLALAAAAVAALYLRPHPVERPAAPVARVIPPDAPAPAPAPAARFEGAVLLAAGGATQTVEGAATERCASGATLREGARIETATTGRVVFAAQPAVTVDVRPESEATLTAMRVDSTAITLARGEVAVDRAGDRGAVAVRAGRWEIALEGDATVRATRETVRVVVLAGRAATTAAGVTGTSYTGPIVLELPADAGDARVAPGAALDPLRLDPALLPVGGTLFPLPPIDPAATFSWRGHGALPAALEALRLGGPATLEARLGRRVLTLEVGSGRVSAWRPASAVAAHGLAVQRPPANAALPSPAAAPTPPAGRELSAAEVNAMSRAIQARIRHCFTRCVETNQCREPRGVLEYAISAEGRAALGATDPSLAGARACLAHEAQFFGFRPTGAAFPFQINVR